MVKSKYILLASLFAFALAGAVAVPAPAEEAAPTPPAYFSGTNTDVQAPTWPDQGGGAAGVWIAPGVGGDDPSAMAVPDLYDRVAHNLFSINMVWVLITGFLVMFMQAGFMMVETGLCRAKNAAHISAMNFMVYPLGCFAFWAYGFAIGWGNWWNGPVAPGWYASLGPGLSVLNRASASARRSTRPATRPAPSPTASWASRASSWAAASATSASWRCSSS